MIVFVLCGRYRYEALPELRAAQMRAMPTYAQFMDLDATHFYECSYTVYVFVVKADAQVCYAVHCWYLCYAMAVYRTRVTASIVHGVCVSISEPS